MISRRHTLAIAFSAALVGSFSGAAIAQGAGSTVKLVVPFAPGGGVDTAARLIARQIQSNTSWTVVVENRAGGSGTVGGKAVQTAAPDGNTLLFSASTHVLAKEVLKVPPYDPQTDFQAVARVAEAR